MYEAYLDNQRKIKSFAERPKASKDDAGRQSRESFIEFARRVTVVKSNDEDGDELEYVASMLAKKGRKICINILWDYLGLP